MKFNVINVNLIYIHFSCYTLYDFITNQNDICYNDDEALSKSCDVVLASTSNKNKKQKTKTTLDDVFLCLEKGMASTMLTQGGNKHQLCHMSKDRL